MPIRPKTPEEVLAREERALVREKRMAEEARVRRAEEARLARAEGADKEADRFIAPQVEDIGARPDLSSPDFSRQLHMAFAKRLWAVASSPLTTVQDVIAGYAATRIAAGVGKRPEEPKRYTIPMGSLLGGAQQDADSSPAEAPPRDLNASGGPVDDPGDKARS